MGYIKSGGRYMKLAEALQERADLNRNIEQLKSRLKASVLVQEGEKTLEDPRELKKELDGCLDRLEYLIKQINLTNAKINVDGLSMTALIAKRDALILKIAAYKDIVSEAAHMNYRARSTEIKIIAAIDVAGWQKEIDILAKELRLLDNKIQMTNWTYDLIA